MTTKPDPTEAKRLPEYADDARTLGPEGFVQRYGGAFLIYDATIRLSPARPMQATEMAEGPVEPRTPGAEYVVLEVRPTGRSAFPGFISVGRTTNNDVVIDDASISKFHAFFRVTSEGAYVLQDSGSTSGSFVDDEPVPAKNTGDPVQLHSGSRLRFGRVEMTFLAAPELLKMISMLFKLAPRDLRP